MSHAASIDMLRIMKIMIRNILTAFTLAFSCQVTLAADLVLTNARIYTVAGPQTWAEAVAVEDGRITYVGDAEGAEAFVTDDTRVVDLGGRMLLPAFQDTHAHIAPGGTSQTECPFFDLADGEAVLAAIGKCVAANPEAPLIRGAGWTIDQFTGGMPPRKELLDAIDSSRPLVMEDADGHAMWLNSKAFEEYGITGDMPDPEGGKIERDPETGELWGTLHEETAMNLVSSKWPAYTDTQIAAGILWAQDYYHSLGITAVQEGIVKMRGRDSMRSLPAFVSLNESGDLKLRVSLSLFWVAGAGMQQIDEFKQVRRDHSSGRLRAGTVKFWADGVVETYTAQMLEPYSNKPETTGFMMISRDEMMAAVPKVDAESFQVHFHAIGDATVRYSLDAVEAAWQANGKRDGRHHMTHVQFVHPDDIPRFAELGMGTSFQPLWAYEDSYITDFTLPMVGEERIQWTYPFGSVLRSGGLVTFASDWSVSSANPLWGIETAMTRMNIVTNEGKPFLPNERISLEDAISAYTIKAAYLNLLEEDTGSVEVGKFADLVVLDRNLFEIPVFEISDTQVDATLFEGEVVYGTLE
jgi:predicted amidohydrolase YtcJ